MSVTLKNLQNTTESLTYGKSLTQANDISQDSSTQPWRTGQMGINASSRVQI